MKIRIVQHSPKMGAYWYTIQFKRFLFWRTYKKNNGSNLFEPCVFEFFSDARDAASHLVDTFKKAKAKTYKNYFER